MVLLSALWLFLKENPWAVLGALTTVAGIVFQVRQAFGKRISPEDRERVLAIALPLIEAGKVLAEKTKTPWDNVLVGVAQDLAARLQAEGVTVKPAAVVATVRQHEPSIANALAVKALKAGLKG